MDVHAVRCGVLLNGSLAGDESCWGSVSGTVYMFVDWKLLGTCLCWGLAPPGTVCQLSLVCVVAERVDIGSLQWTVSEPTLGGMAVRLPSTLSKSLSTTSSRV